MSSACWTRRLPRSGGSTSWSTPQGAACLVVSQQAARRLRHGGAIFTLRVLAEFLCCSVAELRSRDITVSALEDNSDLVALLDRWRLKVSGGSRRFVLTPRPPGVDHRPLSKTVSERKSSVPEPTPERRL